MPEFSEIVATKMPPIPQGKRKRTIEDLPICIGNNALQCLDQMEHIWGCLGRAENYYKKDWVSKKEFIDMVIEKMKIMNE